MPYHLITSSNDLDALGKKLSGVKRFAADTETEGLKPQEGDRVVGTSFSLGPKKEDDHFYVPVRHENHQNAVFDEYKNALSPALADLNIEKMAHNLKFDDKFLTIDGMPLKGKLHDTIVMAHLIQQDNHGGELALKKLGVTVLKEPADDQQALHMHLLSKFPNNSIKELMGKMKYADPNVVCQYACTDTRLCFALHDHYMEILLADPKLMENYLTEMRVCEGLVDLELRGVPMDRQWLQDQAQKTKHELDELLADIQKDAGPLFNPQSGPMVYGYLFETLKLPLPPAERTKTNKVSLGKETLAAVDHPAAKRIEDYRQKQTLLSTYYLGLQPWITDPKIHRDPISVGCIHPGLNQVGTPHARFSCREPNLQNQPHALRPAFLVRENYLSWRWDYSQVEMRVFAHYSGDKVLIDGYNNDPLFDIHGAIAKELGIPRSKAKTVNFLIVYGGGIAKLSSNLAISEAAAKRFLEKYYRRFPGVKRLRRQASNIILKRIQRNASAQVVKWGYVEDVFGRRYYLDSKKAYLAVNRLVAGCAANLMKHGMARVFDIIDEMRAEYGPDVACLIMNIHDEIEVEIRKDIPAKEIWVPRITKAMVNFPGLFTVPIRCDCQVTDTRWSEAKSHLVSV